jgi:hypothetical protein
MKKYVIINLQLNPIGTTKNKRRLYGLRFSFIFSDYPQGFKKSLLTAFVFSGCNYTNGKENERQRAKNGAREGNGNKGAQRNTTHDSKFQPLTALNR